MTRQLDFRLLGPLEVLDGARSLPLGGHKQRSLLALLLLHANEVVSIDSLMEGLWDERAPKTAPTALQVYVSQLRKLVSTERLETRKPGYVLRIDPDELDVTRFEGLCAEADGREPAAAAAALGEALSLWRGPAFVDFAYDSFAQAEIARLEELRLAVLEQRIDADLALGRHAQLVGELEALVTDQPLRERPREQLILALYRSGRQADALEAYRQARKTLVEEHGIEPGPALKELEKSILAQDAELAPPPPRRTNLPTPATSLIGREGELVEVVELLSNARLVTLTGAGGSGKTRLAIQAATNVFNDYPDGVWWVPLAALRDPGLLETTIAQVVGTRGDLAQHLRDKQTLLLLDNFEQLVDAAPGLNELLAQTHLLKLLVTSREPTRLSGEREFPVLPLPNDDAIALFNERAVSVRPDFEPDEAVVEICRRLDGLPLAIELAAARVKVLEPSALLERLEHPLLLLTGGARDAPERQRTLAATIAWSHELLSPEEQALFRRLGVFAGGFTLETAEDLCGADLDTLQSLVEKSLVRHRGDRFAMLETIREYALERLEESGEDKEFRRAHAEFFAELAERGEDALKTSKQTVWYRRLEAEIGNFRAALAWSLAGAEPESGLRLSWALRLLWLRTSLVEAPYWLELATTRLKGAPELLQARVLRAAGVTAIILNDLDRAGALLERALPLAHDGGDRYTEVFTLLNLSMLAREREDLDGSTEFLEEALSLSRALGDAYATSKVLHELGESLIYTGDHPRALALFEESLRLAREVGDLDAAANITQSLGDLAREAGEFDRAEERYRESLALYGELEAEERSSTTTATSPSAQTTSHAHQGIGACLAGLALAAAGKGMFDRAARLCGAFDALEEALKRDLGYTLTRPFWRTRYQRKVQEACEREPAAFAAGRKLDLEEAVELALRPEQVAVTSGKRAPA